MRANNALGLIFANSGDETLPEFTDKRSMASVPFGGRYRIIDFQLSNLVNAGVGKVGIIPRSNYRSLMDHIGSGKPWDLDRKQGGLSFLPPYINSNIKGAYNGHIDAIMNTKLYIGKSREDYVFLCDSDNVCNIDIGAIFESHIKSGADITVAYKHGKLPASSNGRAVLNIENGRAKDILVSQNAGEECDFAIGFTVFGRELLLKLASDADERGYSSLSRGILQRNVGKLNINCYKIDNYVAFVSELQSYTKANFDLFDPKVRADLFNRERPVYTKTRDDMPTRYGLNCKVTNSLIADGCLIDGTVENCILFRGVKVGKGTTLKNCIIMQGGVIGDNCDIKYVTADKDIEISDNVVLSGAENSHFVMKKDSIV